MTSPQISIEKIGLTYLFPIKFTGNRYYVTIPPELMEQFELMMGDRLKLHIIEARKKRDIDESVLEEQLKAQLRALRKKRKKS